MTDPLRIATRKSPLALWQAEHVAARLRATHPGLTVELVPMTTSGDRFLSGPLSQLGGKGAFVKELEQGMLDGRADMAVHSMKDVPAEMPEGLCVPVILAREDPRDAFVCLRYACLEDLPPASRLGTSSLRRQCQLRARNAAWEVLDLRGNVNSRLAKLEEGRYDALILAAAGLKRLGFENRIRQYLEPEASLPAIGQGAIGIECRADDAATRALLAPLDDPVTHQCVRAERALNERLSGGCHAPIAAYAQSDIGGLRLRALVGTPDGAQLLRAQGEGSPEAPEELGRRVAESLIAQGAEKLLESLDLRGQPR